MKKRTILWIGIPLLVLLGFAWAYHLYVKPHGSAAGETADFTVDADSLYSQYQSDEHAADQKYLGKVIEVSAPSRAGLSPRSGRGNRLASGHAPVAEAASRCCASNPAARSSSTPVAAAMIRIARSFNFSLEGCTLTIRLP